MTKFAIKASTNVPNHFEAHAETGEVFAPKGRTAYPTERGLRQALTKAGHTYDKPVSEKAPKATKVNLTNEQALALHKKCMELVVRDENGKVTDWKPADKLAKAAGFSFFGALSRMVKGIRWAQKSAAEKAELTAKAEARKAKKAERATAETVTWNSEAANKVARDNGFPRYRAVKRAAERGDAQAMALKSLCVKAAYGNAVKPMPKPATNDAELVSALAECGIKVA